MSQHKKLRNAIVTVLQAGHGVDMRADLAVYPSEGSFLVECFLGEESLDLAGLTPDQAEQAAETGEIAEYLATAEEAADCYLQLHDWLEKALQTTTSTRPAPPERKEEEEEEDEGMRDLNPASFDELVLSAKGAALVVFGSGGSGAELGMVAILEPLMKHYPNVLFARIDVDSHQELARQYRVHPPACLLFKDGQVVKQLNGHQHEKNLRAALDALKT